MDNLSITEKCLYEYLCRITGHLAEVLFSEPFSNNEIIGIFKHIYDCCGTIMMFYSVMQPLYEAYHENKISHILDDNINSMFRENPDMWDDISFKDCNEECMVWMREVLEYKKWMTAIDRGLPKRLYETAIKASISYWESRPDLQQEDECLADAYWWGLYKPTFIYLREVFTWQEISEYFAFTPKRRGEIGKPSEEYKHTQYYADYFSDEDLLYVKRTNQIINIPDVPNILRHFNNVYDDFNDLHSEEVCEYVNDGYWYPSLFGGIPGKLAFNDIEHIQNWCKNIAMLQEYKYAMMTLIKKGIIHDLVNEIVMSYAVLI